MSAQRCLSMCLLAALPAVQTAAQEVETNPAQPRFIGEVTAKKVELARGADRVFIDELRSSGWYERVWQALAVLIPV